MEDWPDWYQLAPAFVATYGTEELQELEGASVLLEAIEEDDERIFIDALRDLQPGEELFYDYQLEVDEPITSEVKEESRCCCGASNCRGTMLETK